MKVGAIFSPAAGHSYLELRAHARMAERSGFDSFWVGDHFFDADGLSDRDSFEAWTLIAALARETTRIRVGVLVTVAQYRNPALLAKIVASVDQMSGGRVEFGLGAGAKPGDYYAYGYEFGGPGTRVAQMVDVLEICVRLWTNERTTYRGKHYRVEDAVCAPKPVQAPHPPIWVGGNMPRVIRVAAQYADGFDVRRRAAGTAPLTPDELRAINHEVDEACSSVGRQRPLRRSHSLRLRLADRDDSAQALVQTIQGYAAVGLDEFNLSFPREFSDDMIRQVGDKVIAAVRR